jgi:hypothetical protein
LTVRRTLERLKHHENDPHNPAIPDLCGSGDNMQQASRVSDLAAFRYLGQLIERQTEDYVTGRFG